MVPILKVRLPDGTVKPIAVVAAPNLLAPHADSHAVDGTDPLKPEDVGALPITGGELSGGLTANGAVQAHAFRQHPDYYGNPTEIGRYIDMHLVGSNADYDARFMANSNKTISIYFNDNEPFTLLHTGNKSLINPVDIGAVKNTGDTMTGSLALSGDYIRLLLKDSTKGYAYLEKAKDDNGNVALYNERDTNNRSALQLYSENADEAGLLRLIVKKNGSSSERKVLHTGNIEALGVSKIATGSYSGNGSNSTRTFDTNCPRSNAAIVYAEPDVQGTAYSAIVTPAGVMCVQHNNNQQTPKSYSHNYAKIVNGVLTINTTIDYLNKSGVTYHYIAL